MCVSQQVWITALLAYNVMYVVSEQESKPHGEVKEILMLAIPTFFDLLATILVSVCLFVDDVLWIIVGAVAHVRLTMLSGLQCPERHSIPWVLQLNKTVGGWIECLCSRGSQMPPLPCPSLLTLPTNRLPWKASTTAFVAMMALAHHEGV